LTRFSYEEFTIVRAFHLPSLVHCQASVHLWLRGVGHITWTLQRPSYCDIYWGRDWSLHTTGPWWMSPTQGVIPRQHN